MSFDFDFALNTVLPLARAAYGVTELPDGWKQCGTITLGPGFSPDLIARLLPQETTGCSFGIVAQNDSFRALAVRGTVTAVEWAQDFDFKMVYHHSGEIEEGFSALASAVVIHVDSGRDDRKSIMIGHSLGGALATLAAEVDGSSILYTFASPRVGDNAFAAACDERTTESYRIVNRPDIVPHAPPELLGYKHVGTAVEVDGETDRSKLPHFQSEDLISRLHTAHSLDSYEDGLRKLMRKPAFQSRKL